MVKKCCGDDRYTVIGDYFEFSIILPNQGFLHIFALLGRGIIVEYYSKGKTRFLSIKCHFHNRGVVEMTVAEMTKLTISASLHSFKNL